MKHTHVDLHDGGDALHRAPLFTRCRVGDSLRRIATQAIFIITLLLFCAIATSGAEAPVKAEVKDLSINGGIQDGKATLVIEAVLNGLSHDETKLIYSTSLGEGVHVTRSKVLYQCDLTLDILQGQPKEIPLLLGGEGEIRSVQGDGLLDWSIRWGTNQMRYLVLRFPKTEEPISRFNATILGETELETLPCNLALLTLTAEEPALSGGYLSVTTAPEMSAEVRNSKGLALMNADSLPEAFRKTLKQIDESTLAYNFHGTPIAAQLATTLSDPDPENRQIVLRNFNLGATLADEIATFTLNATAAVKNPEGGEIVLLSGGLALTAFERNPDWDLRLENGRYVLACNKPGEFPIQLRFNASIAKSAEWNALHFHVAPSTLLPLTLQGLPADTEFNFEGASEPERQGNTFVTFLPADGTVKFSWKSTREETEGRLFYAAEMLSQVSVSPGLMSQSALLDFKVMQGEMNEVNLQLQGQGEVTRVQGEEVLSWNVEPVADSSDRRLVIQLNAQQKDQFSISIQAQNPLGAFPQAANALRIVPEGATRFSGYHRIVNEGAVRLEVVDATGLSQIAPEQFPESDQTRALLRLTGNQRFVYRFSGPEFALRIQADNILPELSVSEILAYHLGETETTIEVEMELDIREAPVRELLLHLPRGYAIARLNASGLSDYFQRDAAEEGISELRLVYGQPISGRQLVTLRLERNQAFSGDSWTVPRVEVVKAKSTRGHLAISADAGLRLTAERTQGLTEMATAFFPKQLPNIQVGFRMSDPAWSVAVRIERLPQTVQADSFHLFSIGEGIAYGSSTMNFLVSGAPISSFRVALSDEYYNVEFAGKDLRNWQKTPEGYVVHLHTPVSGTYTLLATYERPFKAQGDTLTFTGARPLDAQLEQGHTIVISANQFQVTPVNVSSGLLALEPAEVPAEYRLFFDTPILAAYRYNSRPFNLELQLSPLEQGETVSLVVDRAVLTTRISKEGQIVTDATYFVKNRGNPHLRLTLPAGVELWSVQVDGKPVVPVTDDKSNLIPLPQHANPDALLQLDLKLASRSDNANRVSVAAPIVAAPVLLAEWNLQPDTGQRLIYRKGTLTPAQGVQDQSGFAGLLQTLRGSHAGETLRFAVAAFILVALCVWLWRWASADGVKRLGVRHLSGAILGFVAFALATGVLARISKSAWQEAIEPSSTLTLLAPVQQSDSALTVQVENVASTAPQIAVRVAVLPVLLALCVWIYSLATSRTWFKPLGWILGWTLLGWAALSLTNGAAVFMGLIWLFVLLQIVLPGLRRLFSVPGEPPATSGGHPAAATALLLGTLLLSLNNAGAASPKIAAPPLAESVIQDIQVGEDFALATARIRWHAEKDQVLPVLYSPAVLTGIQYPKDSLKLIQNSAGERRAQQLLALATGTYDIEVRYQVAIQKSGSEHGFSLNTQHGLVNRVRAVLVNRDVDVTPQAAVSLQRARQGEDTVANIVFSPVPNAWIGWKPRSRDVSAETAVFYAELQQLYVPSAGVIEGMHDVLIRPAQGEISELLLDVPESATITDVLDPAKTLDGNVRPSIVSLWRFDPDARQLRMQLAPAQSKPFTLRILSQVATGPLPLEQTVGLISVRGSAGQIGLIGIGTGSEVQLDDVNVTGLTAINLDDFPANLVTSFQPSVAGLTVRRAFRYARPEGTAQVVASAVAPDIRVNTQETLSLGEDRVVLAVNATVDITRAGIFRLSFVLPDNLDVESVSGESLSHWTELKTEDGRIITLNLKDKTQGRQMFNLTLSGSGLKTTEGWNTPHFRFREASKQQGQLVVVPEQGMRLQVAERTGLTQLDPQKAGIRQRGVLAFRLLQSDWTLALDIEQVDAWVQVTSLQHFNVSEAQVKVSANLQYEIENTGLKALRVLLPTNAESIHMSGDQMSDFLQIEGTGTNSMQAWEVRLRRRVIGSYLLQITYQLRVPQQATSATLYGVEADDVNLQRGYVTLQSEGRLQVRVDSPPAALQPAEWQSIPRELTKDISGYSANYTFRLVEASYQLPLQLVRHEAARLLPARVNSIVLTSVISDEGVMLTKVRMEMQPGDKRLLKLTLPDKARFWFSFVNDNGTWPWRETDKILIPLQSQARDGKPVPVEFFYSSQIGAPARGSLDLAMYGPEFDLPLENITWQVYLNEKWELRRWDGTLQLEEHRAGNVPFSGNVRDYLANEVKLKQEQTQAAEEWMSLGNQLLQTGDPQQARAAFRNAYGLSQHDQAFNEDARVQLNNLRVQQALMGLNYGQAEVAGADNQAAEKLRELKQRKGMAYTQDEAQQVFAANLEEDNANFTRLAERIIEQQDAAVSAPAAIRATIPEQGRLLTFRRSVQVDNWAEMQIALKATSASTVSFSAKLTTAILACFAFAMLLLLSRAVRQS